MRTTVIQITKSVLAAILLSLTFVLVFTVIIQLCTLPSTVIKPVNQVFKILSIIISGLLFIRDDKGLIKGAIHGTLAVVLTFLVFGAISLSLSADWKFAIELLLGAIAGGASGIIAVNLKRRA